MLCKVQYSTKSAHLQGLFWGVTKSREREGRSPSQYPFWRWFERLSRSNQRQKRDLGEAKPPQTPRSKTLTQP